MAILKDYQKRFTTEYYQLEEKVIKLRLIIAKANNNELDFKLACSLTLLKYQLDFMTDYLKMLIIRSFKEEIELSYDDRVKDVYLTAVTNNLVGDYE